MALPTKEKTWQYDVNVSRASVLAAVIGLKNSMKAFGSHPWTVWGSSDGSAFGNNDSVDRWGTPAQGGWIVLKQSGISATFSLCIFYSSAVNSQWTWTISFVGFSSNGTALARPTASDEYTYTVSQAQQRPSPNGVGVSHVMMSSDGQCLRFMRCSTSQVYYINIIDVVKNPVTGLAAGVIVGVASNNFVAGNVTTYANFNDATNMWGIINGIVNSFYLTSEGWGTATLGENITFLDDDTGEYPASPITLVSQTLGNRGALKGTLYDLWWGSTTPATGDTYPGDGSKTFAQLGNFIFPWNGTTPVVA